MRDVHVKDDQQRRQRVTPCGFEKVWRICPCGAPQYTGRHIAYEVDRSVGQRYLWYRAGPTAWSGSRLLQIQEWTSGCGDGEESGDVFVGWERRGEARRGEEGRGRGMRGRRRRGVMWGGGWGGGGWVGGEDGGKNPKSPPSTRKKYIHPPSSKHGNAIYHVNFALNTSS